MTTTPTKMIPSQINNNNDYHHFDNDEITDKLTKTPPKNSKSASNSKKYEDNFKLSKKSRRRECTPEVSPPKNSKLELQHFDKLPFQKQLNFDIDIMNKENNDYTNEMNDNYNCFSASKKTLLLIIDESQELQEDNSQQNSQINQTNHKSNNDKRGSLATPDKISSTFFSKINLKSKIYKEDKQREELRNKFEGMNLRNDEVDENNKEKRVIKGNKLF